MKPKVILLMGPTASGKSDLAYRLCDIFPTEIISVDSAQVYREMDIGTAKPNAELRNKYRHHLIDLVDPNASYSVGNFHRDVFRIIAEIQNKKKIPLLVGGTMLYFKSIKNGLANLPLADPKIRDAINIKAKLQGWPSLHEELEHIDPLLAKRIAPADSQRIQRALEIYHITKKPMSSLLAQKPQDNLPFELLEIALLPAERGTLHKKIEDRFKNMLKCGLIEETISLKRKFRLNQDMPSMRCVGYKQAWQYLNGQIDAKELEQKGIAATRQIAKRQLTWLRSFSDYKSFDPFDSKVFSTIATWLTSKI